MLPTILNDCMDDKAARLAVNSRDLGLSGPPCVITRESDKFPGGSGFPVTGFWLHQGAPSFTALDRQGPIMWEIFPETWIWSHFLQVPTPLLTPTLEKGANIFLEQGPHLPLLPKEKWCPQGLGPPRLPPPRRVSATPAIFAGRSPDMSKW